MYLNIYCVSIHCRYYPYWHIFLSFVQFGLILVNFENFSTICWTKCSKSILYIPSPDITRHFQNPGSFVWELGFKGYNLGAVLYQITKVKDSLEDYALKVCFVLFCFLKPGPLIHNAILALISILVCNPCPPLDLNQI